MGRFNYVPFCRTFAVALRLCALRRPPGVVSVYDVLEKRVLHRAWSIYVGLHGGVTKNMSYHLSSVAKQFAVVPLPRFLFGDLRRALGCLVDACVVFGADVSMVFFVRSGSRWGRRRSQRGAGRSAAKAIPATVGFSSFEFDSVPATAQSGLSFAVAACNVRGIRG